MVHSLYSTILILKLKTYVIDDSQYLTLYSTILILKPKHIQNSITNNINFIFYYTYIKT